MGPDSLMFSKLVVKLRQSSEGTHDTFYFVSLFEHVVRLHGNILGLCTYNHFSAHFSLHFHYKCDILMTSGKGNGEMESVRQSESISDAMRCNQAVILS